jgi:ATP-dependent helicase YprA (DUF1998 family)
MTDVLEIKLLGWQMSQFLAMRSLLYGLLEGASEALGIRRDDIEGTLCPKGRGELPTLMMYDNVPGGAGHVERVSGNLRQVFITARNRLERCECGEETSCYNCLRNYRNQYYHDELQRGPVVKLLRSVLASDV